MPPHAATVVTAAPTKLRRNIRIKGAIGSEWGVRRRLIGPMLAQPPAARAGIASGGPLRQGAVSLAQVASGASRGAVSGNRPTLELSMKVPLTIDDFLRRGALVYGDRPALIDEPGTAGSLGTFTYRSVERRARGVAIALDRMGVAVGERVAVVSPNAARFGILFFGVSGFGRILVPINYRLNADEVSYVVEHSCASVLLVDPESDEVLRDVKARHRIVLDGVDDAGLFAEAADDASPAGWDPDEDATASINYTSGTTARPKGVQLTHRNCWLNAATFGWHTTVTDRDVYLHALPMFHCNGWGMPYSVTGMGCKQIVLRKVDGEEILRRVDQHGVT